MTGVKPASLRPIRRGGEGRPEKGEPLGDCSRGGDSAREGLGRRKRNPEHRLKTCFLKRSTVEEDRRWGDLTTCKGNQERSHSPEEAGFSKIEKEGSKEGSISPVRGDQEPPAATSMRLPASYRGARRNKRGEVPGSEKKAREWTKPPKPCYYDGQKKIGCTKGMGK